MKSINQISLENKYDIFINAVCYIKEKNYEKCNIKDIENIFKINVLRLSKLLKKLIKIIKGKISAPAKKYINILYLYWFNRFLKEIRYVRHIVIATEI